MVRPQSLVCFLLKCNTCVARCIARNLPKDVVRQSGWCFQLEDDVIVLDGDDVGIVGMDVQPESHGPRVRLCSDYIRNNHSAA